MRELMKRLEGKMASVEKSMTKMANKIANMEEDAANLQFRVKTMAQNSEGYRKVRHRFLDVCHRDILKDIDQRGYKNISEGNIAAQEGDAVADAGLFTSGKRFGEEVLLHLYGLSAEKISYLGKVSNFQVLYICLHFIAFVKSSNILPPSISVRRGEQKETKSPARRGRRL
jgi:hypothetical protein